MRREQIVKRRKPLSRQSLLCRTKAIGLLLNSYLQLISFKLCQDKNVCLFYVAVSKMDIFNQPEENAVFVVCRLSLVVDWLDPFQLKVSQCPSRK